MLSSLIVLRDRLTARETKDKILDCFDVTAIKNAKRLVWTERESFLLVNKKKWMDHRHTAQHLVEEAKLEDLVDFVNCLDEAENLPTIVVNACDLSTPPTAVFGLSISVSSEWPVVDYTDLLNAIQIKIETLSQDLKESLTKVTKVLESRPPAVQTGYSSGQLLLPQGCQLAWGLVLGLLIVLVM